MCKAVTAWQKLLRKRIKGGVEIVGVVENLTITVAVDGGCKVENFVWWHYALFFQKYKQGNSL